MLQFLRSALRPVVALVVGNAVGCQTHFPKSRDGDLPVAPPSIESVPEAASLSCRAWKRPTPAVSFERVFADLSIHWPTAMVQDPVDRTRWYIAQLEGQVLAFHTYAPSAFEKVLELPKDLRIDFTGGLVGMALHPQFAKNGHVFLHFSHAGGPTRAQTVVGRMTTRDGGHTFGEYTDIIGPIDQQLPADHHGGGIAFGPDGMLYASFGDGGCCDDARFKGQSKDGLWSKIVRVDVDTPPAAGASYVVPPDNPFVGTDVEPATFARGFRNPFRMSFDRATGELWVGDVEQDQVEEIDRVAPGGNYGWPCKEGSQPHLWGTDHCVDPTNLVDPYFTYARTVAGASIVGGYVYRGSALPDLASRYIYADFTTHRVWALPTRAEAARVPLLLNEGAADGSWSAFAEDANGELYALDLFGDAVYALRPGGSTMTKVPTRLAETGCVDADDIKRARSMEPYDVASPLYSDGAAKERYVALPADEKMTFDGEHLELPPGSVTMKTFAIDGKRVETRLFMRDEDGDWAGYSYRWNDDESDAVLVEGEQRREVGSLVWTYPSRGQCLECHTRAAGRTLGLDLRQLSRETIERFASRGWLAAGTELGSASWAFSPVGDPDVPVERRARAYLHSNCSHCHRPGGGPSTQMDLRAETPLARAKLCNADPQGDAADLGVSGAKLLVPGMPEVSVLSLRAHRTDGRRMPPLGTSVPDVAGLAVIDSWIRGLSSCP